MNYLGKLVELVPHMQTQIYKHKTYLKFPYFPKPIPSPLFVSKASIIRGGCRFENFRVPKFYCYISCGKPKNSFRFEFGFKNPSRTRSFKILKLLKNLNFKHTARKLIILLKCSS